MKIKDLELIPPSKEEVEFFKKFMQDHDKGLKAVKILEKIKSLLQDENCHFDKIKELTKEM